MFIRRLVSSVQGWVFPRLLPLSSILDNETFLHSLSYRCMVKEWPGDKRSGFLLQLSWSGTKKMPTVTLAQPTTAQLKTAPMLYGPGFSSFDVLGNISRTCVATSLSYWRFLSKYTKHVSTLKLFVLAYYSHGCDAPWRRSSCYIIVNLSPASIVFSDFSPRSHNVMLTSRGVYSRLNRFSFGNPWKPIAKTIVRSDQYTSWGN